MINIGRTCPADATAKNLMKARAKLQKTLGKLQKLPINSQENKTTKAFNKILDPGARTYKSLKDVKAMMKAALKAARVGSAYTNHGQTVLSEYMHYQDRTVYLLQYQIRVIDLCLARAENNEKVLAEKKKAEKNKKRG